MEYTVVSVATVDSHRRIIAVPVSQLPAEELEQNPTPDLNSVAVMLKHPGGNLHGRWTDFPATDGKKKLVIVNGNVLTGKETAIALMTSFVAGWTYLESAPAQLTEANVTQSIDLRGYPPTIPEAVTQSITHLAYHVSQLVMIARPMHEGLWNWLTSAPGNNTQFNKQNW